MRVTLTISLPAVPLPTETATVLCEHLSDWSMTGIDTTALPSCCQDLQNLLQLADTLDAANFSVCWQSKAVTDKAQHSDWAHYTQAYDWPAAPTILALVPHWRCGFGCVAVWHRCFNKLTH